MTKQLEHLFLISVILLITTFLNGCVSEYCLLPHSGDDNGEGINISIRVIQQSDAPDSRGVSRPICDSEQLMLNTGDLYFVTSTGITIKHYSIVAGNILDIDNRKVGVERLIDGVTLPAMSNNIARVVIIGNYDRNPALPTVGNVNGNTLLGRSIDIITQHNALNVNLRNCPTTLISGRTELNGTLFNTGEVAVNGNRIFATTVHLTPTVARFEIADITGTGSIASFGVEGIFIDNYFRNATISGTPTSWVSNGDVAARFVRGSTQYPTQLEGAIFDWYENGRPSVNRVVAPDGTDSWTCEVEGCSNIHTNVPNVWGYQLFATGTTATPNIVIRLRDVVLQDGRTLPNPQFVTVSNFFTEDNDFLENMTPGNVYRIAAGALQFREYDLMPLPNQSPIAVEITIGIGTWGGSTALQRNPVRQGQFRALACPGRPMSIFLAPAIAPDANVTYRWEQSIDGLTGWTTIGTEYNLINTVLTVGNFVRRVAIWNGREFPTEVVEIILNCNVPRVTAHTTVMYDFQSQPLEMFFTADGFSIESWQWQVSTDNVNFTDIAGAGGTSYMTTNTDNFGDVHRVQWLLRPDFMHESGVPALNADYNLYFRIMVETDEGPITQLSDETLQIRFIQTTQSGGSSPFLRGFGMTGTVRWADMGRPVQANPAIGNTIRIALLNLGAHHNYGGLGYLFQWGRRADGHQTVRWVNCPETHENIFGPGTSNVVERVAGVTAQGQPNPPNPNYFIGPAIWSTGLPSGASSAHLWGGVRPTDAIVHLAPARIEARVNSNQWRHIGANSNNPCPAGWRVATRFEWYDMRGGNGSSLTTSSIFDVNASNEAITIVRHGNRWEHRPRRVNAAGGAIVSNTNTGGTIFLPMSYHRQHTVASGGQRGNSHLYWTSCGGGRDSGNNGVAQPFTVRVSNDLAHPPNTLHANVLGNHNRAFGGAVRCVANVP